MLLNEYDVHERGKELHRAAQRARLTREALAGEPRVSTRAGRLLLALGARLVTPSECEMITTSSGYTVKVCSPQAA